MNLFQYIDRDVLASQIDAGMIKETAHPSAPLHILNYTQKAQFTPELWTDVTDKCRGLIFYTETKMIVSRPFVKFWSLNDGRHPETLTENLPSTVPSITQKMDGSLGILYRIDSRCHIATRGSFVSDQATWATKWIQENTPGTWPLGWTPLFEIIYPENRIVVRYEYSALVLLAMVDNYTGEEANRATLRQYAEINNVRLVDEFDKHLTACTAEDSDNEEGYVAAWERPGTWPLRVKIKMETYKRLHRLLTQCNAATVWGMLKDGSDLDAVLSDVPEEFSQWLRGIETRLRSGYKKLEDTALRAMLEYPGETFITNAEQRKQFALYAVTKQPVTPILFAMLDRKKYDEIIWKMIRPRGDERPFITDDGE